VQQVLIFISILGLYAAGWPLVVGRGGLFRQPLPAVFYLSMFLFNGVGSFYVVWPQFSQIGHLSAEINTTFYLIVVVQILVFYLFWFFNLRYRIPSPTSREGLAYDQLKPVSLVFWVLSLAMVLLYVFMEGMPYGWTINPLSLGKSEIISMRTASVQIRLGFLRMGFYYFPIIAALAGMLMWLERRHLGPPPRWPGSLLAMGQIILGAMLTLAFLHKTPLVMLLFALITGVVLYRQQIRWRFAVLTTGGFIVLIGMLYLMYNPAREMDSYITFLLPSIIRRISGSYTQTLAAVIALVEQRGTFGGMTLSNPGLLIPYTPVDLPSMLHLEIMGREGNAPVGFAGEGFANFRWPGVLLFLLLANGYVFLAQAMVDWFGRRSQALWTFLAVFFVLTVYQIPISSISLTILNPVMLIALAIILALGIRMKRRERLSHRD